MTQPFIGDGALIALFNAVSLAVVAYFQYKTKKEVKDTTTSVKENSIKLDEAAVKVTEAKEHVQAVHEIANGRLTEALDKIAFLQAENDTLKAAVGQRRQTDTRD